MEMLTFCHCILHSGGDEARKLGYQSDICIFDNSRSAWFAESI